MPTGYTAAIADGITFEQFVMQCARAFGACVTMRDEPSDAPIPDEFKPSTYHAEQLVGARKLLAELRIMAIDEAEARSRQQYNAAVDRIIKSNDKTLQLRSQYEVMLQSVAAWQPPSPDHNELKRFMQKQIQESIKWDCTPIDSTLKLATGEEWLSEQIDKCLRDIEYHAKEQREEDNRTAKRNLWVKQLRESLSKPQ